MKRIFEEQKDFLKYFFDPENISETDKIKFTKEHILAIHKELSEVLDTIPWKLHRRNDEVKSKTNTIEEIIDCFKFLINLCIIWGIDDEKFINEFKRKTMVVRQRYNQEILNIIKPTDKVCAVDIDDTIANSSEHFTQTYNIIHQSDFKNRLEIKNAIPELWYEDFKKYFRESGEKLHIPVKEGAKELCDYLKEKGYKIVLISARPYETYSRIFPDTMEWLKNNEINYDALYFEKDKHIKILKRIPNISFILEDDVEYAKEVSQLNYKVFLLTNKEVRFDKNIIKIRTLQDMLDQNI